MDTSYGYTPHVEIEIARSKHITPYPLEIPEVIIFDLSEVLIPGLLGIEKTLCQDLNVSGNEILACFCSLLFEEILLGNITEDVYLRYIITKSQWPIKPERLKVIIRQNFHRQVAGMQPILKILASRYRLALLSDHVQEWVSYIRSIHPFLDRFERTFFSYDLKSTKSEPKTFRHVLAILSVPPKNCLFIDDNLQNIRVAESVGIPSIHFQDATQLRTELRKRHLVDKRQLDETTP